MLKWLWLSLAVVVLDQLTKYWAVSALPLYTPVAVMPSLNLTLTRNTGAAFSLLNDAGGWQRWLFIGLALLVSTAIVVWLRRLRPGQGWWACALALVAGGAVGNVIDRLAHGYVIDFIDVYYRHWHWPAFNLADSAITVGAAMLVIEGLFGGRRSRAS